MTERSSNTGRKLIRRTDTKQLRAYFGFTQCELADLLGVHSMTVSKWERGKLEPAPFYCALLGAFERCPEPLLTGSGVIFLLKSRGVAVALAVMLQHEIPGEYSEASS